jgi:putative membrane protein
MRIVIAVPVLLLVALFALSNPQTVRLGLWPTDFALQAPLSLVVLLAMAVAFFIGAVMVWVSGIAARQRARRAEYTAKLLEEQIRDLQARLLASVPASAPPAPHASQIMPASPPG